LIKGSGNVRYEKALVKNKGQALVETALILPIIIVILMGIIDFGLLFNNYLVIANAAREGARSAAVGSTDALITTSINNMTATLDQTKITITISPVQAVRKKGDEVTVTVKYDNTLLTPVISAIIPNPVHLTAKTVMRVE
jgi:Flp pilus assembly protein TadG